MFISIDPASGKTIEKYEMQSGAQVEAHLEKSARAWQDWRQTSFEHRKAFLYRLAELMEQQAEMRAVTISTEMGKPLREAIAEIRKCAATARHYAEHGHHYFAPHKVATEARLSQVQFEPLGPVLAIMPWNFPWWQAMRFFIPAVLAGNVALLKHAENVQGCSNEIIAMVAEAAGTDGLLQNLVVAREQIENIIADRRVAAVTLTGSVRAGRAVGAAAGANGKKAVLELGGSDPFIVTAEADLEKAVRVAIISRFGNAGQSCVSAKRFLLDETISARFLDAFREGVAALQVGNPLEDKTAMGPLAREDLRDTFADQINRAIAMGAKPLIGGQPMDRDGFFYQPTILTNISASSPAATEELFGPAAAVFTFQNEDEAIALANSTSYGLGASIWNEDIEAASAMADRIAAGAVFVNDQVRSDPRVPFGGIMDSGYGRELGELGAREFTNAKLKWVA